MVNRKVQITERHPHKRNKKSNKPFTVLVTEDQEFFVAKYQDNPQGKRVLANELVASGIARELNLPSPEGVILEITEEFIKATDLKTDSGAKVTAGLHYGSSDSEDAIYKKEAIDLIGDVSNKNKFPGIVLFDMLTINGDRDNAGNYFVKPLEDRNFTFHIIDHGHCFGTPNWDKKIDQKLGTWTPNYLKPMAANIVGTNPFTEYIDRIKNIRDDFIDEIVDAIPSEWDVPTDERTALSMFLKGQRDSIDTILYEKKVKDLFPNVKWV